MILQSIIALSDCHLKKSDYESMYPNAEKCKGVSPLHKDKGEVKL